MTEENQNQKKPRKIAFVGSDKSEIILYFAKFLKQLNQKVLMLDYSETEALFFATHTTKLLAQEHTVECYGVDFSLKTDPDTKKYDFILADFGYQFHNQKLKEYEEVWIITDAQIHHVKKLETLKLDSKQKRVLLFKNMVQGKINTRYLIKELQNLETDSNCYTVLLDAEDLKAAINCQYDNISFFDHISREYYDFFCDQLPEFSKKQLKKTFKKAGRGKII